MTTFNRNRIIVKSIDAKIGNKYYFSSTLSHLEEVVKTENNDYCGVLQKFDNDGFFIMENGYFGWKYLYPCN